MLEKFLRGGGKCPGVFVLGGNCPGGICPGVIVRGVIVRGVIVLIPFVLVVQISAWNITRPAKTRYKHTLCS